MDVAVSARKHGIADADMEHPVRNAVRVLDQGDRDLYIGTDFSGRPLEVVVLDDDGTPVILHAVRLRPTFYDRL